MRFSPAPSSSPPLISRPVDLGVYPLNASPDDLEEEDDEDEEESPEDDSEEYDSDEQFELEFRNHKDYYYMDKMKYKTVTP